MPQTEWLKQQTFISHSSEAWNSNIKVQADLLPGVNSCLLAVYSHGRDREKEREERDTSPVSSFLKGINSIMRAPPLRPNLTLLPPKVSNSKYYHIGD